MPRFTAARWRQPFIESGPNTLPCSQAARPAAKGRRSVCLGICPSTTEVWWDAISLSVNLLGQPQTDSGCILDPLFQSVGVIGANGTRNMRALVRSLHPLLGLSANQLLVYSKERSSY
jgi:hypothetical protein